MLSIVSGVVVAGAGVASIWHFKPHEGKLHPLVTMPILQTVIPVTIVSLMAVGIALIIAGLTIE